MYFKFGVVSLFNIENIHLCVWYMYEYKLQKGLQDYDYYLVYSKESWQDEGNNRCIQKGYSQLIFLC